MLQIWDPTPGEKVVAIPDWMVEKSNQLQARPHNERITRCWWNLPGSLQGGSGRLTDHCRESANRIYQDAGGRTQGVLYGVQVVELKTSYSVAGTPLKLNGKQSIERPWEVNMGKDHCIAPTCQPHSRTKRNKGILEPGREVSSSSSSSPRHSTDKTYHPHEQGKRVLQGSSSLQQSKRWMVDSELKDSEFINGTMCI